MRPWDEQDHKDKPHRRAGWPNETQICSGDAQFVANLLSRNLAQIYPPAKPEPAVNFVIVDVTKASGEVAEAAAVQLRGRTLHSGLFLVYLGLSAVEIDPSCLLSESQRLAEELYSRGGLTSSGSGDAIVDGTEQRIRKEEDVVIGWILDSSEEAKRRKEWNFYIWSDASMVAQQVRTILFSAGFHHQIQDLRSRGVKNLKSIDSQVLLSVLKRDVKGLIENIEQQTTAMATNSLDFRMTFSEDISTIGDKFNDIELARRIFSLYGDSHAVSWDSEFSSDLRGNSRIDARIELDLLEAMVLGTWGRVRFEPEMQDYFLHTIVRAFGESSVEGFERLKVAYGAWRKKRLSFAERLAFAPRPSSSSDLSPDITLARHFRTLRNGRYSGDDAVKQASQDVNEQLTKNPVLADAKSLNLGAEDTNLAVVGGEIEEQVFSLLVWKAVFGGHAGGHCVRPAEDPLPPPMVTFLYRKFLAASFLHLDFDGFESELKKKKLKKSELIISSVKSHR